MASTVSPEQGAVRVRKSFKKQTGKHFLEQLKLRPQSLETGACQLFKTLRSPQLMILAYGSLSKNRSKQRKQPFKKNSSIA